MKVNKLDIAVLIAVHASDSIDYLDRAIKSISVEQTRAPDQIVLVKDGPLESAQEEAIERWINQLGPILDTVTLAKSVGLGAALNAGLERCKCPLVARMDSDDVAFPERLEVQGSHMERNPDLGVLGSAAVEIDLEGNQGATRTMIADHEGLVQQLWACPFLHPTTIFRKELILRVGGYNGSLRRRQDYELWFRVLEGGGRFANLTEPLLLYRFDRSTHKKQGVAASWRQGAIGFHGSRRVGLPFWKQLACFVPFVRALFPAGAQHGIYRLLRPLDPRR